MPKKEKKPKEKKEKKSKTEKTEDKKEDKKSNKNQIKRETKHYNVSVCGHPDAVRMYMDMVNPGII